MTTAGGWPWRGGGPRQARAPRGSAWLGRWARALSCPCRPPHPPLPLAAGARLRGFLWREGRQAAGRDPVRRHGAQPGVCASRGGERGGCPRTSLLCSPPLPACRGSARCKGAAPPDPPARPCRRAGVGRAPASHAGGRGGPRPAGAGGRPTPPLLACTPSLPPFGCCCCVQACSDDPTAATAYLPSGPRSKLFIRGPTFVATDLGGQGEVLRCGKGCLVSTRPRLTFPFVLLTSPCVFRTSSPC